MLRVVVMVSGGGTNLQAILDAVDQAEITNCRSCGGDQQQSGRLCTGAGEKARCAGMCFSEGL